MGRAERGCGMRHEFFDRKQSEGNIKAVGSHDWYSLKNGEIRAVVTEFDECYGATTDIRYCYSVAFYGQSPSPNYKGWNGAFAWCVDFEEMERFLKNVAALKVEYEVAK